MESDITGPGCAEKNTGVSLRAIYQGGRMILYRLWARNTRLEKVFSRYYQGKLRREGCYDSGSGSSEAATTEPYVAYIQNYLEKWPGQPAVVDMGCGDMRVGRKFLAYCSHYTAIDIVAELIAHHKSQTWPAGVEFQHLDMTREPLPQGDICFLRQVLQHLSNAQISQILPKLRQYKTVFITEHYPADNVDIRPNVDKIHGLDIRAMHNSGVYLDRPPFNIPAAKLKCVLEAPGTEFAVGCPKGVIRTCMYNP